MLHRQRRRRPEARQHHGPDHHASMHRSGGGLDRSGLDGLGQANSRNRELFLGASHQGNAELVAGIAGQRVATPHDAAQPFGNRGDHLVGHVEPVGLVQPPQSIDADQRQRQGLVFAPAADDLVGQQVCQLLAGQPACQLVALAGPAALARGRRRHDPHHAMHPRRAAVDAAEPATGILKPEGSARR